MIRALMLASVFLTLGGFAGAQPQPFRFAGAASVTPPVLHCPDANCPADRVINQGPVVEMKTRRTYFLDYPCDLAAGETVTLIDDQGIPATSTWAAKYQCGPRLPPKEVVDTKAGYVYDGSRQKPPNLGTAPCAREGARHGVWRLRGRQGRG